MALTALPCDDLHAVNTTTDSLELFEQIQGHSYDVDLCSPFCSCYCGQTLPPITSYNSFHTLSNFDLAVPCMQQDVIRCSVSLWHPPKI